MAIAKIVTYNLRCCWKWTKEGIQSFIFRAGMIYEKILYENPDIIAFQEIVPKQLELLKRMLPEYEFYGQGRDKDFSDEGLYIAARKGVWSVVSHEAFWLSDTPNVPASRFAEQSDYPRICVTADLRHIESGKMLRIFDVHFDLEEIARDKGMKCVLAKMAEANKTYPLPTMLMGDFNARPGSETIRICEANTEPKLYDITDHIVNTCHDYGKVDDQKIDYIYVTEDIKNSVVETDIWKTCYAGIYLSDHYPVYTNIDLDKLS